MAYEFFYVEVPDSDEPVTVRVRLLEPQFHDRDGLMHVDPEMLEWNDVEWGPVEGCGHVETICRDCVERWCNDYEIRFDEEVSS